MGEVIGYIGVADAQSGVYSVDGEIDRVDMEWVRGVLGVGGDMERS